MKIIYLLTFINTFIVVFATLSKGALFTSKAIWEGLHLIILICLLIIGVLKFGWIQIIWILLIDILAHIPCAFILNRTIFKNK